MSQAASGGGGGERPTLPPVEATSPGGPRPLAPDAPGATAENGPWFGILGPLEALHGGRPVALGGAKERVVLAHLIARANTVVSVDALVDSVWSGSPPKTAERTLQAYVARLRRALEPRRSKGDRPTLLVTSGNGYSLVVGPERVDAMRFEELARRGAEQLHATDPGAGRTLTEALTLWRGDAYGEFGDLEACAAEGRRLTELRTRVVEDRFEAELAAGGSAALVSDLERAVADRPFRERLWGQLMLALYRAGRQRDALSTFQRARALLVDELGVEPGPQLRHLEAAILDQDPELDLVDDARRGPRDSFPVLLDAVGPAFVGRGAELAMLREAWADAAAGDGGFISVVGPEGIGKTRLVAELAREVHRDGAVVLYGRCDHAHRGARALLDQALRSAGAALIHPEAALSDLAAAALRDVSTWAAGRPALLVLDDLHLADADTLEVVADLAAWSAASRTLVVAAFQSDAPADEIEPEAGRTQVQIVLAGLDREAVAELCAVYAADEWAPGDFARLHELTAGVPLRVHEQASEWARRRATDRVQQAASLSVAARARLVATRRDIADSVEGIQHLLEQRRANLAGREAELGPLGFEVCPYKGLAAFEAADTRNFFGRERLVAELVSRVADAHLLAVVGASGSGKSSLVRAGLLPALEAGVIPVPGGWTSTTLNPGAHPAEALARRSRVVDPAGRRVVFIDQFEEVFTQCDDPGEQTAFVDDVVRLAGQSDTVVVLAVRADHLAHCAARPQLADLMTGNDALVGPMREAELRRAIELPARRAGLVLEPGLVDVIVSEVLGRRGALPLMSTALAETWERRTDRTLTLAGYRAAGGVNGALARLAEDAYQSLAPEARVATRRLLVRLCDVGGDGPLDVRRRLPLADLFAATDANARAGLDAFVDRRLLTVDRDTVEIAHEALLREWPQLRMWLDEDVHGRRLHAQIGEAARAWRVSGDDPSELYRGTRLDAAVDWASTHGGDLTETERAFVESSRREAAREVDEARRRAAEQARANRRLQWLLAGVGGLLVMALITGVLFLRQRDRADDERAHAEATARAATAREIAGQAELALDEDPERAILLGLEAVETTRAAGEQPVPEAMAALHRAVQASRLEWRGEGANQEVDANSDGTRLITASIDPESAEPAADALVWDAGDGRVLRTLSGPGATVWDVAFAPDGRNAAVSYDHTDAEGPVPAVIVFDTVTGDEVARLEGPPGRYWSPTFSRDGSQLAVVDDDRVFLWRLGSGLPSSPAVTLDPAGGALSVQFLPDGASVVVTEPEAERLGIYSTADGRELDAIMTSGFAPEVVRVDPAGRRVAVASQSSAFTVQIWNLQTRELERSIPMTSLWQPSWSPDGERLALSGYPTAQVRIVDPDSGAEVMVLRGHVGQTSDVAYIGPDRLASVDNRGELRVWDVSVDGPPEVGALSASEGRPHAIQLSPDGYEIVLGNAQDVGVERLDVNTGEVLGSLPDQQNHVSVFAIVSPDWRYLASVGNDGQGMVRALDTLAPVAPLPPCGDPLAFTPDGSLIVLDNPFRLCTEAEMPAGIDRRSTVRDVESGEVLLDFGERGVFLAAFNPGGAFPAGRFLAVVVDPPVGLSGETVLAIYDMTAETEPIATLTSDALGGSPRRATFSADGALLHGGTFDGVAWVLDVRAVVAGTPANEAVLFQHRAHSGSTGTALSANGLLGTSSVEPLLRFWDITTGELTMELRTDLPNCCSGPPFGGAITFVFSPDGTELFYVDAGSVIRRFPLDVDRLVEQARGRVTRNLTADECLRYLDPARCPT